MPDDERLWVPQTDTVSFRPLCFNTSLGYYVNLLRVRKSGKTPPPPPFSFQDVKLSTKYTKQMVICLLSLFPGLLNRHRHTGPVHGFVVKGTWKYLEHDWVATEGSYVFEPPGALPLSLHP